MLVREYCEVKMFYICGWKNKKQLPNCGLQKVLLALLFKGAAVLEILKLGGQYFCFSFKQLVENRNRQAMKA